MQYQTFPEAPGDSDSAAKLKRIRLPEDLTGLSFLDIGCNEGFFCQEAWRRGASRVVGVDRNPKFVERAQTRDPNTEYRVMDWAELPNVKESFDLVLLLSALHYAFEPERLLRNALDLLNPDGLLVLECGIAPGAKREWVAVERPIGDTVRHPTHSMLMQAIRPATGHRVGPSMNQLGDPVKRDVYHLRLLKPMVLLVSGSPRSGKTTLVRTLRDKGSITINLDSLIMDMTSWCRDESLLSLRSSATFTSAEIHEFVDIMVRSSAESAFVEQVLATQRPFTRPLEPELTVLEGYVLSRGNFQEVFTARLRDRGWFVWYVEPGDSPDHLSWRPQDAATESS